MDSLQFTQLMEKLQQILEQLQEKPVKNKKKGSGKYVLVGWEEIQNHVTPIDDRETHREILELAEEYRGKYDKLYMVDPNGKKSEI
jgi:hypothetical protein